MHPAWAKQAFAYRLVHMLTPKALTKRLPRGLQPGLIAPGVTIPPGFELPGGMILSPGAELPPGWTPGDPLPPGMAESPTVPPGAETTGPTPPTYTAPWSPGPVTTAPPGGAVVPHGSGIYYPAASGDDGEWVPGGWFDAASFWLYFGLRAGSKTHSFITFNGVMAPQGSTILSAYLTFIAGASQANTPVDVVIYANDVDSPTNPTNLAEAEALVMTTASVAWAPGAWTVDQSYNSDDITTIIQEIVDRPGWTAGNNLMIVIKATDTSLYYRAPYSFDWKNIPALYVEW